jgi:hypothetical protein
LIQVFVSSLRTSRPMRPISSPLRVVTTPPPAPGLFVMASTK